ncbi:hypothetical protein [Bacteroides heparinolyticus]|uniref:hypothetical protein n=1 Tax=Prevotella heparinolytica TaxID=28113 RepID=UPI0023F03806|nr:hypothetical protein [Bacteroides heparinolyticus]
MKIQLFLSLFSFRRFGILPDADGMWAVTAIAFRGWLLQFFLRHASPLRTARPLPSGFLRFSSGFGGTIIKEEVCFYMLCFVYRMPLQRALGT